MVLALALVLLSMRGPAAEDMRGMNAKDGKETVVLLHGLSRSPRSMKRLEAALSRGGYAVTNVGYPAGRRPIENLSGDLDARLTEIRADRGRRVHFVTHSFGGILLRCYLGETSLPNLGRVVMPSPPNGGSELADLLAKIPLVRRAAGPNRRRLGTDPGSLPAILGPVDFDLGVITGDRSFNPLFSSLIPGPDDGFVGVERAKVRGMTDFLVVPRTHTFIVRSRQVIEQTLKFLRDGSFDHHTPA